MCGDRWIKSETLTPCSEKLLKPPLIYHFPYDWKNFKVPWESQVNMMFKHLDHLDSIFFFIAKYHWFPFWFIYYIIPSLQYSFWFMMRLQADFFLFSSVLFFKIHLQITSCDTECSTDLWTAHIIICYAVVNLSLWRSSHLFVIGCLLHLRFLLYL